MTAEEYLVELHKQEIEKYDNLLESSKTVEGLLLDERDELKAELEHVRAIVDLVGEYIEHSCGLIRLYVPAYKDAYSKLLKAFGLEDDEQANDG